MSKFNRRLFVRNVPVKRLFTLSKIVKKAQNLYFHLFDTLWFKLMPGTLITIPYPTVSIDKFGRCIPQLSSLHEELSSKVGKQLISWHWTYLPGSNELNIKFRKDKSKFATLFAMRWS